MVTLILGLIARRVYWSNQHTFFKISWNQMQDWQAHWVGPKISLIKASTSSFVLTFKIFRKRSFVRPITHWFLSVPSCRKNPVFTFHLGEILCCLICVISSSRVGSRSSGSSRYFKNDFPIWSASAPCTPVSVFLTAHTMSFLSLFSLTCYCRGRFGNWESHPGVVWIHS